MSNKEYTFMYFPVWARGELSRWCLAASGLKYVDKRITFDDWKTLKATIPQGTLPCLITPEGHYLSQSASIARYIARIGGLAPSDPYDLYRCDEVVDLVEGDIFNRFIKFSPFSTPEDKATNIKAWNETNGPNLLGCLSKLLSKGNASGYFVGDRLTYADLASACIVDRIQQMEGIEDSISKFPDLVKHSEKIKESGKIKEYLKNRPEPFKKF